MGINPNGTPKKRPELHILTKSEIQQKRTIGLFPSGAGVCLIQTMP